MPRFPELDVGAWLAAMDAARVSDFVRFVNRRTRERPELGSMTFRDAWMILLAEYLTLATEDKDRVA